MELKRLDIAAKQNVQYAVPLWLRDEQIKLAIEKVPDRIQQYPGARSEPVAIVGYGPSLRETWEQVKAFAYIISCSGSHKFLIERNIIPKWHVEVDPRSHKVALLGMPHSEVTYLPASTCHPAYFDHLLKHNAKIELWHVFDNDREAIRVLPRGEWAITGGCDVGLRAMTIAGFFGFTDLHVFGLDGSAPSQSEGRHAGEHPHGKQPGCVTTYEGREFYTTPAMLEAARMVWHELNQMPNVKATFYGDGLIQHMAKFYKPEPVPSERVMLGFSKPDLISAGYRDLQLRLHRDNLAYGVGAGKHGETIIKLSNKLNTKNILDYGCGKGYLAKAIPWAIDEYDPAIPGKEESPKPADLVVCTDVLEHIEPDKILLVLDDLRRCVKQVGYFVIHTGLSTKSLADGRNAHILQRDRRWWKTRLSKFFQIAQIFDNPPLVVVLVVPKPMQRSVPKSVAVSAKEVMA